MLLWLSQNIFKAFVLHVNSLWYYINKWKISYFLKQFYVKLIIHEL